MAIYEVGGSKTGVNTSPTIYWTIRSNVTTRRIAILEIGIEVATATTNGADWRLLRTATTGTSSTTIAPLPVDPINTIASNAVVASAWSAAPTTGTVDLRRLGLPNTQGSSLIWSWPEHRPLIVDNSATGGLAITNQNATGATVGAYAFYVVLSE